jgi:hypothetical protein
MEVPDQRSNEALLLPAWDKEAAPKWAPAAIIRERRGRAQRR